MSRLVRATSMADPVRRTNGSDSAPTISVVIPARDEAARIGPLLDAVVGAPGVTEVLVVDDESNDDTASIAESAGATVIAGARLPDGWAGKSWALQQGIERATGTWVVTLDADTRPDRDLPASLVARAAADRLDLLTVAGRFECPTPGSRWLHPAMLTTLVYRFGPPGSNPEPARMMANGQCMTFERQRFLDAGAMALVKGEVVEDIALARHLAISGRRVDFLDASDLLTVRMFESFRDVWVGWGRSLALPGVETRRRQLIDLGIVALAQALPLPRLLMGRGDVLDVALLAMRIGTLFGTRTAYSKNDAGYWASPAADLPATFVLARGVQRRGAHVWRGRSYA